MLTGIFDIFWYARNDTSTIINCFRAQFALSLVFHQNKFYYFNGGSKMKKKNHNFVESAGQILIENNMENTKIHKNAFSSLSAVRVAMRATFYCSHIVTI